MIFYGSEYAAAQVSELELCGYGGDPPPAIGDDGWPNDGDQADFRIRSSRLVRLTRDLQAELLKKVASGELYATGYAAYSPLSRPAERIEADRWRLLEPDFEKSQANGPGGLIAGILVFQTIPTRSTAERLPSRFSQAEVRSWYKVWIQKNAGAGRMPSRHDDWAAAKAHFEINVPRDLLREIRRELAPEEWKRFGRRKLKTNACDQQA